MRNYIPTLILFLLLCVSCRQEIVDITVDQSQVPDLTIDTPVTSLLQNISLNDGSKDNIIDMANCFTIEFPYTVTINEINILVENEDDFDDIENILEESVLYTVSLNFPITIRLVNHTTVLVANQTILDEFATSCNAENVSDDDIECLDLLYPIRISSYNTRTEQIRLLVITSDEFLYEFIEDLDENEIANIQFPISVFLSDGTIVAVASIEELETLIDNTKDDCDEDDNFDFNDDDCPNCELEEVELVFITCPNWFIEDFKFAGSHTDDFEDFTFNFLLDNMLSITNEEGDIFTGNWYVTVDGDITKIEFIIPAFTSFNMIWELDDLQIKNDESKIKLEVDSDNHIRFENECGEAAFE